MFRTAAKACSMLAGACPAVHSCAMYSAGVCPVAACRPCVAHQAVKAVHRRAQARRVLDALEAKHPVAAQHLDAAWEDLLAFAAFPHEIWSNTRKNG